MKGQRVKGSPHPGGFAEAKKGQGKNKLTTCYLLLAAKNGFTLIEIVMIIVIVAIALPAMLFVLGEGSKQGTYSEIRIAAAEAGQAMMEEIKAKCWDETATTLPNCGGTVTPSAIQADAGEGRQQCTGAAVGSAFDDVDDYNGYSETCSWNNTSYTTNVTVCYVDAADLDTCIGGTSDFKRITVTVSNAYIRPVSLITVVGNY